MEMPILGVLVLFQRSRLAIVMFSETLCRRENFGGVVEGVGGGSRRGNLHTGSAVRKLARPETLNMAAL